MEKTLVSIASDALSQLGDLWNTMGVQNEERASYLSQITSDVATMYATCVSRQVDRKSLLDAEIQGLQTTIEDMQVAMDEPVNVVSAGIPFLAPSSPPTHRSALTTHLVPLLTYLCFSPPLTGSASSPTVTLLSTSVEICKRHGISEQRLCGSGRAPFSNSTRTLGRE